MLSGSVGEHGQRRPSLKQNNRQIVPLSSGQRPCCATVQQLESLMKKRSKEPNNWLLKELIPWKLWEILLSYEPNIIGQHYSPIKDKTQPLNKQCLKVQALGHRWSACQTLHAQFKMGLKIMKMRQIREITMHAFIKSQEANISGICKYVFLYITTTLYIIKISSHAILWWQK